MNQSFLSTSGLHRREGCSQTASGALGLVRGVRAGKACGELFSGLTLLPCPALPHSKNAQGDEKANLTAQALDLSLKYHFVTPLTSLVVTKPEDNEDQMAIADKPGEGGHGEWRLELGGLAPGPGPWVP